MDLLKLIVLLIAFGAAMFIAYTVIREVVPWWNRRIGRYVSWIVEAMGATGEEVAEPRAQRLVSASILGPALLMIALGAWPLAIPAAAAGFAVPYAWVRFKQYQRRQKLDNQLVDALILMANGMKSGLSLLQALELAASESRRPMGDEFTRVVKEIQLGRSIDEALLGMAERIGMPDLEMAVHSIVTLRETGGNLSETFMTVANTVVERKKIEGKISALTAQGVYQGVGLCAMPFVMALVFYVMDPEYMGPMLTTGLGWLMWGAVIILDALGMWMILKIVKIDV
ncbi:MAG: type II secretion system F family protein [Acidobacteriota bacterium]